MSADKPLTYATYLRLEQLLAQQQPLSDEHDELLFIVIHQVYELWFKQVLHELYALRTAFEEGATARALACLKRILTILKTLVGQVDILETMTPLSFNAFRARLDASSGFQSAQFREIEFLLGHRRAAVVAQHRTQPRLAKLMGEPALWDAFLRYLGGLGHAAPPEALERNLAEPYQPNAQVQDLLVSVYRKGDFAATVCERLVDLDEGLQEWRYRHVKMVERTIGMKPGTGGSAGAEYLRRTLFQPLFPDLWEIRTRL